MLTSIEKTQLMVISKEPIRCKLEVNNKVIQQVMKFNYLSAISSDKNLVEEVRVQANRANGILERDHMEKPEYIPKKLGYIKHV